MKKFNMAVTKRAFEYKYILYFSWKKKLFKRTLLNLNWGPRGKSRCPSKCDFYSNKGSLMYFSYMTERFRTIWDRSRQIACKGIIIIIKFHVFLQGCTSSPLNPANKTDQPRSDCSPVLTSLSSACDRFMLQFKEFTVSESISESKPL